jgi:hypothetical protein
MMILMMMMANEYKRESVLGGRRQKVEGTRW